MEIWKEITGIVGITIEIKIFWGGAMAVGGKRGAEATVRRTGLETYALQEQLRATHTRQLELVHREALLGGRRVAGHRTSWRRRSSSRRCRGWRSLMSSNGSCWSARAASLPGTAKATRATWIR